MEMDDEFHDLVALLPGKLQWVPTRQEVGWPHR
jgi:hypothetical protein